MNLIRTTKESSERLGACELCREWCSEVFILTRYLPCRDPDTGEEFHAHRGNLFGHKECLEEVPALESKSA